MTKVQKCEVDTRLHEDGAVSHKIRFTNGETRVVLVKPDTPLIQQHLAHSSKNKILAAVNSVDSADKAVEKVDALDKAWAQGKWSLQAEGDGKVRAGVLAQALALIKGCEVDVAEAYVKTLSRAEQAKLRAQPVVAARIIEIERKDREGATDLLDAFLEPIGEADEEAA